MRIKVGIATSQKLFSVTCTAHYKILILLQGYFTSTEKDLQFQIVRALLDATIFCVCVIPDCQGDARCSNFLCLCNSRLSGRC